MGTPVGLPAEDSESGPDCIPQAFSKGLELLSRTVLAAARGEDRWLERIRVGLTAALGFLDEHSEWARLLVLEAPLDGAAVRECVRRAQDALGEVLEHARSEVIIGARLMPPAALIAELLVGALLSLVRARMLAASEVPLVTLAPSLMRDVVEPYVGAGAGRADGARRDVARGGGGCVASAERCVPAAASRPQVLPIRMTPRYVAALWAIASRPHCSNREIDAASGGSVNDGNVAQLLGRLARRGLVENTAAGRGRGHTNAWLITPYGRRVLELNRHALPAHARASVVEAARATAGRANPRRSNADASVEAGWSVAYRVWEAA